MMILKSPLLVPAQDERYHNHYIPADHPNVKQVHHPQALSDPQHQKHGNRFAEYNTAHSAEVDGQTRNERIYFKASHAECSQRRE